ncbi:Vps54-like protein [Metarhizium robertsii ARSEF 23]|uniref:Vps54-like protein n=1 Tax=Metarhizium robertsii (strain ARSEF 23 / ATCC MYA-3075) TaxID=655844 RepID=E9F5N4_METRA|nr:Vps54-like protein [Metarhizium robertsii ARSEF 23]EFY97037.2 Vps54-like protein [Metarhizium robertsii ARSEF 23]
MADSIHSTGGLPDTTSGSWASAVLETGQNGILKFSNSLFKARANVLKSNIDITSTADTEFKPYLTQVGALYEQLRRLKESEDEPADTLHKSSIKPGEFAALFDDDHLQPGKRSSAFRTGSVSSVYSLSPTETSVAIRKFSAGSARRATQSPPPLSTIPRVYFDADFHLENPRTFDVVSERSEVVRPPPRLLNEKASKGNATAPRKALATNAILQEKLSWYMDTIEMYLIASISAASTAFFTALSSLQGLQSEAADSVQRIKALRKELQALDNEIVMSGLNIIQKRQRQEHLQQLHDAVQQLKHIVDSVVACESLVDNGEVEKALKCIDSLEKLTAGEPDSSQATLNGDGRDLQLRDLRAVTALQGVNDDIITLRFRMGKACGTRFLSLLMGDLGRHTDAVSTQEVLMRWTSASVRSRGGHTQEPSVFPSYMSSIDGLRFELLESLTSLYRAKHLTSAASAYREAVLKEIRNLVQRPLPTSNDDDNESILSSSKMARGQLTLQEQSSILARNLRALQPEEAEELLIKIYISVTETLRRLTTQVKLLLDVASPLGDDTSPSGLWYAQAGSPLTTPASGRLFIAALEAQEMHKAIDLQSLLGQAVDVAQDKIVKLLRVRSEQSTHLSLIRFLRYFALNLYFANECESISGQSGTTLKTIINGQIQDFIQKHGDTEKQKLAQGMESDKWEAKDFSEKQTAELNRILSCSIKDPAEWSDGMKLWIPYSDDDPESHYAGDPHANSDGKAKTMNASIDEETFVLPSSAILCMNGVARFLQLIAGIPSMTSDIGASLVSYLQLFNSRCTQLILGAGARQSAGLKNITSKHLVLASQALAFVATLISYIREFVRRHAGTGAAASSLVEFDKVKRLYQDHQNSIYDKIVEIMTRLAASHVRAIIRIDWDNDQKNVHSYMATLTKDTTSLHRILTKTLPDAAIGMIMTPVFISYRDQFGKAFQEVDLKTELGRESMLHDIEFFESNLGKLDGFGDTVEYLTTIIKAKQVKTGRPANLSDA